MGNGKADTLHEVVLHQAPNERFGLPVEIVVGVRWVDPDLDAPALAERIVRLAEGTPVAGRAGRPVLTYRDVSEHFGHMVFSLDLDRAAGAWLAQAIWEAFLPQEVAP